MADLSPYENRDVLQATIRLTNAGDGLSAAMNIAPAEYHIGDVVHLVIEAEVTRISHEPIGDTEALKRVHTLRAGVGTIVSEATVAKSLNKARRDLERARGVERLFPDADEA